MELSDLIKTVQEQETKIHQSRDEMNTKKIEKIAKLLFQKTVENVCTLTNTWCSQFCFKSVVKKILIPDSKWI